MGSAFDDCYRPLREDSPSRRRNQRFRYVSSGFQDMCLADPPLVCCTRNYPVLSFFDVRSFRFLGFLKKRRAVHPQVVQVFFENSAPAFGHFVSYVHPYALGVAPRVVLVSISEKRSIWDVGCWRAGTLASLSNPSYPIVVTGRLSVLDGRNGKCLASIHHVGGEEFERIRCFPSLSSSCVFTCGGRIDEDFERGEMCFYDLNRPDVKGSFRGSRRSGVIDDIAGNEIRRAIYGVSYDRFVEIWDLRLPATTAYSLSCPGSSIYCLASENLVVFGNHGCIEFRDPRKFESVFSAFRVGLSSVNEIAHIDKRQFVACGDGNPYLISFNDREGMLLSTIGRDEASGVCVLKNHRQEIFESRGVAEDTSERVCYLATCVFGGCFRLWILETTITLYRSLMIPL